jgi:hypothetical protein
MLECHLDAVFSMWSVPRSHSNIEAHNDRKHRLQQFRYCASIVLWERDANHIKNSGSHVLTMLFPSIGRFFWLPNFGLVQTCRNILRLSTEYYVKSAHPKCADIAASRKIASVKVIVWKQVFASRAVL